MPEQYAWADLMLHTSISEGQSMAITEAAASGVLLAGTRVGLLHDLGDECGLIVEVGDFEGLALKVLNVLIDDESWNKKIQNARNWSDSHDLQLTINELKGAIQSILKND
jgi:glycosyltransferase involved in cell wall biosynthesis